jgi:hypothetical protein
MMGTSTRIPISSMLAMALAFGVASPVAESQMYRWTDEHGSVNYSDEPPSERSGIRDLTLIDIPRSRPGAPDVRSGPNPESEKLGTTETPPIAVTSPVPRSVPIPQLPVVADTIADTPGAPHSSAAPQASSPVPTGPEAVRDPCLRSSDPKCHQRNRHAYVPGLGYSPSALKAAREAEGIGLGATSGTAAGTLTGGTAARPSRLTAPSPSTYALPPGSVLPVAPLKR